LINIAFYLSEGPEVFRKVTIPIWDYKATNGLFKTLPLTNDNYTSSRDVTNISSANIFVAYLLLNSQAKSCNKPENHKKMGKLSNF
jgi:hypothetical protein